MKYNKNKAILFSRERKEITFALHSITVTNITIDFITSKDKHP